MGSTKKELVEDLQEELVAGITPVRRDAINKLITQAKQGFYHDFDTPLPMPKVQLHRDLLATELPHLAKRVTEGAYNDEPPTAEQAKELMDMLTPDLQQKFESLMKKQKKK